MLDQEIPDTSYQTSARQLSLSQLSLFELFFLTTFFAAAFAIYLHCSELLALLGGGCFIVVATVRFARAENEVIGGLLGFVATLAVVVLIFVMLGSRVNEHGWIFVIPMAGYFYGLVATAFRDDSL